jgi:hypothetical protein
MTDTADVSYVIDPKIKDWATATQAKYIDAVNEHGSMRAASRALDVNFTSVRVGIIGAQQRAALQGYSPDHDMTKQTAPGFRVKGTSTLYDADGALKQQWVKTERDAKQAEEAIREFVRYLTEDCRAMAPLLPMPDYTDEDLLAVYPMGDPHFGMYAWASETGDDFDLNIAERLTCEAIDRLVASGPAAATALLLNLGDFFHADNGKNQTPESGHSLDVDTRHGKVLQVGLRALRHCILRMLQKHKKVIVKCNRGNHDPESSYALALCLWAYFENEPRVEIDLSPSLYWYMRFGKVLVGSHHGHGAKASDLGLVMAADRPADWGRTEYRYWYCGHIHHKFVDKEQPGVMVETFRTLAPRDAWHAGKGYRAGRDMNLIILHREYGEVERHRCDVALLLAPTKKTTNG